MEWLREKMKRRPVAWFFAIALATEIVVIMIFLFSGAAEKFDAAVQAAGLEGRTDFVSAYRLAVEAPQAMPGIALSILQPLTPDIAAFAVAAVAFGFIGVTKLVRGFRFWSGDVGWRRGLKAWGAMFLVFIVMLLATAGLNYLFAPESSFRWVNVPILSWGFLAALFAALFLDVGGVTEETGWRGFALPILQGRMTPLAATLIVGLLWGIWHFPARPDILLGSYGLGGGALLLGILAVRFLFLSIVMTYFYNRAGGSTLIAIAMHGLHNDSMFLGGRIEAGGLIPYVISELALLAPIVVVALGVLLVSGRALGLAKGSPKKEALRAVRPDEAASRRPPT